MKEKILNEINKERDRQDSIWGEQNHRPLEWIPILGEEVGEVNKAALEAYFGYKGIRDYSEYRKELIQVAATAIAMIESYDRNEPADIK
ncbi:MazG-like family protein [Leptospira interrogans]|uniref:MazG-like family protein n=1 Tax=Leptospira interrogans TaxID=173 RepID=UPI0007743704|nr:MazG-like family protein [Leptospira interrogans]